MFVFKRERLFFFLLDVLMTFWLDDLDQRENLVSSPFFLKVCLLFFEMEEGCFPFFLMFDDLV